MKGHALVTGGGTGVGRATALALAEAGWQVTVMGRRSAPLEAVAAEAPGVFAESADVTDFEGLGAAIERAQTSRGPFEAVIANAGLASSGPFHRLEPEALLEVTQVNLHGAMFTARHTVPGLRARKRGRLVFVASTAGLKGYPYVAHYCAAKHGVVGLMRALALELAPHGVTCNAVCPGFVDTPLLEKSVAQIQAQTGRSADEARSALAASNPQGRLIAPEEVAAAVLYLVSEGAAAVNGHTLTLSGGEI